MHSKKYPSPGKLISARKPYRKPFLVPERVSDLGKRSQKYLIGFRGLGNLSVSMSTDFDTRKVF